MYSCTYKFILIKYVYFPMALYSRCRFSIWCSVFYYFCISLSIRDQQKKQNIWSTKNKIGNIENGIQNMYGFIIHARIHKYKAEYDNVNRIEIRIRHKYEQQRIVYFLLLHIFFILWLFLVKSYGIRLVYKESWHLIDK